MASVTSNKVKYLLGTKAIDFANDTFIIILMASGFNFDRDEHHGYADVSAYELATGNGYTQDTVQLSGVAVTENDTDDYFSVTWSNVTWTASAGNIGPTPGAIVYDDTVTTPTEDPIIGYINFGADMTQASGGTATISNIEFRIA